MKQDPREPFQPLAVVGVNPWVLREEQTSFTKKLLAFRTVQYAMRLSDDFSSFQHLHEKGNKIKKIKTIFTNLCQNIIFLLNHKKTFQLFLLRVINGSVLLSIGRLSFSVHITLHPR